MRKIKLLALSLCFILILGAVLNAMSDIFKMKESTERYSEFWENPGEYDIWFIGTSHTFYSVQPMELWREHGIRSYDLAAPNSYMLQTYWTMMCALQYGEPQLVVLDPYKVHLEEKHQDKKQTIHIGLDAIPFSKMKIDGICDIFDSWGDRFEYISKFSIYHNRWEELSKSDFEFECDITKGGYLKNKIEDQSSYQVTAGEDVTGTEGIGFRYLEKIIEECRKRGIELLLVEIPFGCTQEEHNAMNTVSELAQEHGIPFLNLTEQNLIDYGVDYGDRHHVNLFGAEKITRYMGDYLSQHYELTDYRGITEVAEKWNADYQAYLQFKQNEMFKASRIKSYVQWLKDDRYTCYMYQKKKPKGLLKKEIAQLDNITYISLEEAEKRMGGKFKGEYAFFVENDSGEVVDKAVFKKGKRQ